MPSFGTGTPNGGMTVYYVQNEPKVTAFPKVRLLSPPKTPPLNV